MVNGALPSGWSLQRLGDLFDFKGGGTPDKKNPAYWGGDIPWASVKDIKTKYLNRTIDRITEKGLKESAANLAKPGDLVLLTRIEPGKVAIAKILVAVNQDCKIAKPKESVDLAWAYYMFLENEREFIKRSSGTTVLGVRINDVKEIMVALPPLEEQRRIVEKIETLFSELDKGIESLKTAREQLKVYRQAVLKHAFEGKLTAQWREENEDDAQGSANVARGRTPGATKLESPEQLLARIQQERQDYLNNKVADGDLEAKRYLNKTKKSQQTYPVADIAASACWVGLIDICLLIVDCHNKTAPYQNDGIWLIRTPCIRNGKIHFNQEARFISSETYEYWSKRCPPEPGDLIFTREAPMGEAGIVPDGIRLCMGQRMMLLRPPRQIDVKYLLYAMMEPKFIERMNSVAVGTGVKHLRVGDVEQLCIPLFSLQEQKIIVEKLEETLSIIEEQEREMDGALLQSEILRQAILKKAFLGQLVSQDLCDESASVLFERIKTETAAQPPVKRKVKA